jgi:hypothetical protein
MLSDPDQLRASTAAAGLTSRDVTGGDISRTYPDLATALRGLNSSGLAIRIAGPVGNAVLNAAVAAALARFVRPDGTVRFGARHLAVLATA